MKAKIKEIELYIEELLEFMPENFEDYMDNFKTKAACERYFEKIIEAAVDLAFLVVKERRLKLPEDDKGAFDVLCGEKVISKKLSAHLKEAKGMRNIIAHQCGNIDNKVIFTAMTEELIKDINEFLNCIRSINAGGRI